MRTVAPSSAAASLFDDDEWRTNEDVDVWMVDLLDHERGAQGWVRWPLASVPERDRGKRDLPTREPIRCVDNGLISSWHLIVITENHACQQ
jgi:hypothetical protein